MKLLFDENISPHLPQILSADYPDSAHVRGVGLKGAEDSLIWQFAKSNGFVIVSKDTDFRDLSYTEGFPPKIIWLDIGDAGTDVVVDLFRTRNEQIRAFNQDPQTALLVISRSSSS